MAGFWQGSGTTTMTVSAAAGSPNGGQLTRLRSLCGSCTAAGNLSVTDSVAGVIFQLNFGAAAVLVEPNLDLRSTAGGNLTIAWSAGGATIAAGGDFVPTGYSYGIP